jgi:hypothetical protein
MFIRGALVPGGNLYATGTAVLIGKVCPNTLNCFNVLFGDRELRRQMITQLMRFIAPNVLAEANKRRLLASCASPFAALACGFGTLT